MKLSLAPVALAAALAFLPAPATANAPAPFSRPGTTSGPFLLRATRLRVDSEALAFDCGAQGAVACAFVATYEITNPEAVREEALGAFYGASTSEVSVRAGGVDARRTLDVEQLTATDAEARRLDPDLALASGVRRTGFAVALEPGAHATLVFEGTMTPITFWHGAEYTGFVLAPQTVRHPILGTPPERDQDGRFRYFLLPIKGWAGAPSVSVSLRCPAGWTLDGKGWTRAGDATFTRRIERVTEDLEFGLHVPARFILPGGPILGLGGRLDTAETRLRAGYEIGLGKNGIASLALESDLRNKLAVVPAAELATPGVLAFFPSFGLGVGVPVQARRDAPALVGIRVSLTVAFPLLSLALPIDCYPGAEGTKCQSALVVQLSL